MLNAKFFPGMLMCALLLSLSAVAEETGNLQITCKPGIQIYIDDQIAGITTEQDGGLLEHGITAGIHKVRGENAGFVPSEFEVSIRAGETKQIKIGKDGAPMVLIPAGEFRMGSNDGRDDEKPEHTVYLDRFYIDKYEVTNALYRKFIAATGHKAPYYWNDSNFNAPDQPVVGVTWDDAKLYCHWAGKQLPTEAQWEKAARGGLVGRTYPRGDSITHNDANYSGTDGRDRWEHTAPVGSFAPNGYGLYDMAGNIREWCADWYGGDYYANSPGRNPTGPSSGSMGPNRILRGGDWDGFPFGLRIVFRTFDQSRFGYNTYGFRCAGLDAP